MAIWRFVKKKKKLHFFVRFYYYYYRENGYGNVERINGNIYNVAISMIINDNH